MTAGTPGPRDPIREALADLPRARASREFTDRLAERWAAEGPLRARRRRSRLRLALAAGLLLIVAATAGLLRYRSHLEAQSRRAALQRQHDEIQRELEALRARVADRPTLYLGAADDFDVVLDLGPWMEPGVQPASYTVSRP